MLYCGLDLHAKESYLYVIDKIGHRIMSRSVPTQARTFKEWLGPLVRRKLMVIVEASTMTVWAVEQMRRAGAEVVVVDPRRVRLTAETRRKTDRADARDLAELARTGALPPPLTLPSEQAWVLRARLVVRRGFVAQCSSIINSFDIGGGAISITSWFFSSLGSKFFLFPLETTPPRRALRPFRQ
jgi:transposase